MHGNTNYQQFTHLRSFLICAGALLVSTQVVAQTATTAPDTSSSVSSKSYSAPEEDKLDTIVVTAQRRAERPQDVPITISNITSEQLTLTNTQSLREVANLTSGVRRIERLRILCEGL